MTIAKNSISVCAEDLEPHTEAICNNCAQPYHLNQRTDVPGKDCGQVWINEDHLALEFGCDNCLNPEPEAGNLDDVLDLAEAAAAIGYTEEALTAAADLGQVRHRKTGSGVYLFSRGDLRALQAGDE